MGNESAEINTILGDLCQVRRGSRPEQLGVHRIIIGQRGGKYETAVVRGKYETLKGSENKGVLGWQRWR